MKMVILFIHNTHVFIRGERMVILSSKRRNGFQFLSFGTFQVAYFHHSGLVPVKQGEIVLTLICFLVARAYDQISYFLFLSVNFPCLAYTDIMEEHNLLKMIKMQKIL